MPDDVHVDGTAVRALAHSHAAHAVDLSAAAADLAAFPVAAFAAALGPVGDRFAAALSDALTTAAAAAAGLAGVTANGADLATGSASAYDDVALRAAALIPG